MSNPLLEQTGLPAFSQIKPEHVEPAIDSLLADNRERIADLLESVEDPDWYNLVEPIEEWEDRLGRVWSPVSHMNSVVNSDGLRAAYNACLPKLSDYGTEMGHNAKLYAAYKAAVEHVHGPTVILARTIKGYGLGEAGEGRNITHQQKKLNLKDLVMFRDRLELNIPDKDLFDPPLMRFPENSAS